MNETSRPLPDYPVVVTLPVQWGEQDAFGHVNNVVYFRWFETARIAYGIKVGLATSRDGAKIGPIVAALNCNYRRQVKFPDTIHVGARITKFGRTSLVMEYAVFSEAHQAIAADGDSTLVVFDYTSNRPRPIPDELRTAVKQLEEKRFDDATR
jgi:acyl-CoA thioester hydrolase